MRWWPSLLIVVACGDNLPPPPPPLPISDVVTIVAHPDDDLLFMAADLGERLRTRRGVTTVYVTSGDGGHGLKQASARMAAIRSAYGEAVGSQAWDCAVIEIADHPVDYCKLRDRDIAILGLGVPDGGVDGGTKGSLLQLFAGTVDHTTTIAEQPTTYTRDELIDTVGELVEQMRPQALWTLDVAGNHGADHSDHGMVGTLALLARARAGSSAALVAYRGYNINQEPAMLPDMLAQPASLAMRAYEACVLGGCGTCGVDACATLSDPRYDAFVHRHYAAAAQRPRRGWLRSDGGCLVIGGDGSVGLAACDETTVLSFMPDGRIESGGACLDIDALGAVTATADCTPAPSRALLVDGEGHVWAGAAADAMMVTAPMHALCLGGYDGKVTGIPCGALVAPTWRIERPPVRTPHTVVNLGGTGRVVQLADVTGDGHADLCAVVRGSLRCAAGTGTGSFAAPKPVAWAARLAPIPESLALGDVDGDGTIDACGVSAVGASCVLHDNRGGAPLSLALPATSIPSSLEIGDQSICARDANGLNCGALDASKSAVTSPWPAGLVTWLGDLDGDGATDWCAIDDRGPACGLASERDVTTDGIPWGYSPETSTLRALGDVTGDGLADLCSVDAQRVACAPAVGHGFGPRITLLELPAGATAKALWLGDLDGDGRLDACVDTDDAIECALSP